MRLRSWNCTGCTNRCYRMLADGKVYEYCRPALEGWDRGQEWITEDFIDCLDKTTDPAAMDPVVRMHPDLLRRTL